ncbi:uncharacterized protein YcfL [Thermonema lapsum]|uniref:Uncharacterized protein YcfL n=1 Tax=Thermonema lapsum TaxID=28195 RepID=A0A846MSE4_9BACT|nr:hypothetical protein [Thermonema lapsum]NIK74272.1 uncharacterized protein YcfL [Thermonema lapsum]
MKKLFLMLLAAGSFALVSCGEGQKENAENQEQPAAEDVQPAEEKPAEEQPAAEETQSQEAPAEGQSQQTPTE